MSDITPTPPKPAAPEKHVLRFESLPEVGKLQNTFRLGHKWADRLKAGDTVEIGPVDGKATGKAAVANVVTGTWSEVAGLAVDNHEMANLSPLEAPSMLRDRLEGLYKSFDDKDTLTVIYLVREA